jgi:peroxiredoxin
MRTRIPELRTVLPNFRLPDSQGGSLSLWDYRHKQPVILVFCGERSEPVLGSFVHHYEQYRAGGAEVLVVSSEKPASQKLPFPFLWDSQGDVSKQFSGGKPAVLLVDRYGELDTRLEGPWETEVPDHQDILDWLVFVESQCPECGVSHW